MPDKILELLSNGAGANTNDKFRQGNVIRLPDRGRLIVSGDLHGHRRNFERILAFTNLDNNPDTHLLLQEIIHGGPQNEHGGCLSFKLLFDAIACKLKYPEQVHIIMGNHDTSFINNTDVMKDGKEMNRAMRDALKREFKKRYDEIDLAMRQFLFSQPLAVKCENRIWLSHSLPADRYVDKFDPTIFDRKLKINETIRPGSAYLLTWGRKHSQDTLDKMAQILDVDIFILGHQPQSNGWQQAGQNLIIFASEHSHGCLLPIDLSKSYTVEVLKELILPIASITE